MTTDHQQTDQLLGLIEQSELPSLKWGYVDGALSQDEINHLAGVVLGENASLTDKSDLREDLIESGLVIEIKVGNGFSYRSRFAEGVRLIRNLRQWFPNKPWTSAPSLISDFRVDARPRRYPSRNIPVADIDKAISDDLGTSNFRTDLLRSMLGHGEQERKLSEFQLEATRSILREEANTRGVIVSAGTGAGKTLAFYLPALLDIADWVEKDDYWVKAVALYPRVELLKDQFSEAFRLIRSMDSVMIAAGKRPIILGSFFGSTPSQATRESARNAGWTDSGKGYICPYLSCPECSKNMIWLNEDLDKGLQRLTCINQPICSGEATKDQISLIKGSGRKTDTPPDISFTTTESLNSRISDIPRRYKFGISHAPQKRVRLILLDEIHTYSGTSGAHAALLLRRWFWAIGQSVRVVGLSATLDEPVDFFHQLTGIDPHNIDHIFPNEESLTSGSMEYQLLLRADPASRASLLSTTIQTTFLLARLLDQMQSENVAEKQSKTHGRFGSKMFVFTDDLDMINRLYDDLMNAEGTRYKIPDEPPLALLRSDNNDDPTARDRHGQNWRSIERFGRDLRTPLRISRTSSQDTGVELGSEVIVATASLEVGFDDPAVGAVIQHKAPYGLAAFAQRKGRAGRPISMRPWMVTVLSDYGRDRLAFQSYDKYLDVVVPPQVLPVHNRYLLRMQAVFAFIDWLASDDVSENHWGWWWQALDGPASGWVKADIEKLQSTLRKVLADLLNDGTEHGKSLRDYLSGALGVTDQDELDTLLWDAPRSLFLEVLPTLDRRLKTDWNAHPALHPNIVVDIKSPLGAPKPLPDFVPNTLFSDLDLPEVSVLIPPPPWESEPTVQLMPIVQSLKTFAPGRVSRRFGAAYSGLQHWVPVPKTPGEHTLEIDEFSTSVEALGTVITKSISDEGKEISFYRPWTILTQQTTKNEVGKTSNSFLRWESNFTATGEAIVVQGPASARWGDLISVIDFHLNRLRSPIVAKRFATGADASLNIRKQEVSVGIEYSKEGRQTAIGFEQEVDGFIVKLSLPNVTQIADRTEHSPNAKAWKVAYFLDLVHGDSDLSSVTNSFQRDWLAQMYLSGLIEIAVTGGHDLPTAHEMLTTGDLRQQLQVVSVAIFQATDEIADAEIEIQPSDQSSSQLSEALLDLLENPLVRESLQRHAKQIWDPQDDQWHTWLRVRLHETFAEATIDASISISPLHTTSESLLADLSDGIKTDENDSIWITESTLGGTGAVEAISQKITADQAKFMESLEASIAPGDVELVATQLDRFIKLATQNDGVISAIADYRAAAGHAAKEHARGTLHFVLSECGLGMTQTLSVALNHRLLREGTDPVSDRLIAQLVELWTKAEEKIGITIDLRVFSYLAVVHSKYGPQVAEMINKITGQTPDKPDAVGVLSGILWQRPSEVRRHAFSSYNPFRKSGYTDPSLIRDLVKFGQIPEVDISSSNWREEYAQALRQTGFVTLLSYGEDSKDLHSVLHKLIADPVDVNFLQFYPAVYGIERREGSDAVTLVIREMV